MIEALKSYEDNPELLSAQLELEISFEKRYGRVASAPIISRMGHVWGPSRSFRVFASSLQLKCDFDEECLKPIQPQKYYFVRLVSKILFSALLFGFGVVILMCVLFVFKELFFYFYGKEWSFPEIFKSISFKDFLTLITVGMGVIAAIMFGSVATYLGFNLLSFSGYSECAVSLAKKVKELDKY